MHFIYKKYMSLTISGIGVDDMFVMVSSWRFTSPSKSVEERMAKMMSTAAVSITITSLTDALAFALSCISPFQSLAFFGGYTSLSIVVCYVYAITFLAACMTYSGRREAEEIHALACSKAVPKSKAGWLHGIFFPNMDQIPWGVYIGLYLFCNFVWGLLNL